MLRQVFSNYLRQLPLLTDAQRKRLAQVLVARTWHHWAKFAGVPSPVRIVRPARKPYVLGGKVTGCHAIAALPARRPVTRSAERPWPTCVSASNGYTTPSR